MENVNLTALVEELLAKARDASSGRAAVTLHGGRDHALRQTVMALTADHGLGEHDSPGEATLQVLRGRVRLVAGDAAWEGSAGDYVVIPPERHSLDALEDSAIILTVAVALS